MGFSLPVAFDGFPKPLDSGIKGSHGQVLVPFRLLERGLLNQPLGGGLQPVWGNRGGSWHARAAGPVKGGVSLQMAEKRRGLMLAAHTLPTDALCVLEQGTDPLCVLFSHL